MDMNIPNACGSVDKIADSGSAKRKYACPNVRLSLSQGEWRDGTSRPLNAMYPILAPRCDRRSTSHPSREMFWP